MERLQLISIHISEKKELTVDVSAVKRIFQGSTTLHLPSAHSTLAPFFTYFIELQKNSICLWIIANSDPIKSSQ